LASLFESSLHFATLEHAIMHLMQCLKKLYLFSFVCQILPNPKYQTKCRLGKFVVKCKVYAFTDVTVAFNIVFIGANSRRFLFY